MKKYICYPFLILTLISGCGKENRPHKAEARTVKVQTAKLQQHEFREIFRAQGGLPDSVLTEERAGTMSES